MFLGTHPLRLDDKGRLFLPAKFRDDLAGGVVITKGQDRCLYVFSRQDFERRFQQLGDEPLLSGGERHLGRILFARAFDQIPDRQGRVTLDQELRRYAGLQRDCVVIGANNRLEIWDTAAWTEYESQQEEAFAALGEGVPPRSS